MSRVSPPNTNICLGVKDPNPKVGTELILNDCSKNGEDIWYLTDDGDLKNKKTGLCVATTGSNNFDKVILKDCTGNPDMRWFIHKIEGDLF